MVRRPPCYRSTTMNESQFSEIATWLTHAGLAGEPELAIVTGFCERIVAAGLPIARSHVFIDTLDPVHEGRLLRWGTGLTDGPVLVDYGRSAPLEASAFPDADQSQRRAFSVNQWRRSPFFHMLQTGEVQLRRRLMQNAEFDFGVLPELLEAGMTDYVALISPFATAGSIGDMDGVYSSWSTMEPDGFEDADIRTLQRLTPFLALAIKSTSLARMTGTLMRTYLGRDAAKRVLSGRIERGVSDRIDAVLWFSDLRGFTLITDTTPQHVIPLLNDYADVIVSAIHEHDGDVLKLMGDGILAIFPAADRNEACNAALKAAAAARHGVAALSARRLAANLPATDLYLGLHVGEVFYGNIGSKERLDFTVIGPAVNEVSRIAAMCRSVDQPLLVSDAFAAVGDNRNRLVSVGRYALRGVGRAQELFTLDPELGTPT